MKSFDIGEQGADGRGCALDVSDIAPPSVGIWNWAVRKCER